MKYFLFVCFSKIFNILLFFFFCCWTPVCSWPEALCETWSSKRQSGLYKQTCKVTNLHKSMAKTVALSLKRRTERDIWELDWKKMHIHIGLSKDTSWCKAAQYSTAFNELEIMQWKEKYCSNLPICFDGQLVAMLLYTPNS